MKKIFLLLMVVFATGCAVDKQHIVRRYAVYGDVPDYWQQQKAVLEKHRENVYVLSYPPYNEKSSMFVVYASMDRNEMEIWFDKKTFKKKYVRISKKGDYTSDGINIYIEYDENGKEIGIVGKDTTDLIEE